VPPCVNTFPAESVRPTESRRELPRKVMVVTRGVLERDARVVRSLNQEVPWGPPEKADCLNLEL
jgi:hypothetical protein